MSCVVGVRRRVGRDGVEGRSAGTSGRVGVYTVQEPGKPRQNRPLSWQRDIESATVTTTCGNQSHLRLKGHEGCHHVRHPGRQHANAELHAL